MLPLEWALDYALIKTPVFPCDPISKKPLTRHGFKDATVDQEQIKKWWTKHPTAMIGSPTGLITHTFVLDINPPEWMTIPKALAAIQKAVGSTEVTNTMTVQTPKGLHLWYYMPDHTVIRNRGPLLDGAIDCVRGEGGYVILPGSVNKLGQEYSYLEPVQLARPASPALIELVKPL